MPSVSLYTGKKMRKSKRKPKNKTLALLKHREVILSHEEVPSEFTPSYNDAALVQCVLQFLFPRAAEHLCANSNSMFWYL